MTIELVENRRNIIGESALEKEEKNIEQNLDAVCYICVIVIYVSLVN